MGTDLDGKHVLVLSDNDGLARAIEVNLCDPYLKVTRIVLNPTGRPTNEAERGDYDLIVVALSSPANEPVVALAWASLAGRVGQVPFLIISDRPFRSDPADRIAHLYFPFDIDRLHGRVSEILLEGNGLNLPGQGRSEHRPGDEQ